MNYFEPSVIRARECRAAMDAALWSSVSDLLSDPGVVGDALVSAVIDGDVDAAGPTRHLDFAAYFDLTLTPAYTDATPQAAKAAAVTRLARRSRAARDSGAPSAPLRVSNFSLDDYTAEEIASMTRWWDIEPDNRMAMTGASAAELAHARSLVDVACGHLRAATPVLCEEIETIVRDIVLSRPDPAENRLNYGGASSFALWGALTINVETQIEWLQFFRQIVHEAGHNLLFGIARDGPLVLDDASVRVASPIRADPRPMDGVFHAAFVSARESFAFDMLLRHHEANPRMSDADAGLLADLLEISVLAFFDCRDTLREDAALTPLGDAILTDCEGYMTANFAVTTR